MKQVKGGVTAAKGFEAASTAAGIKYKDRTDMALVYSQIPCVAAGTFTTNVVKAAPVKWDQQVVKSGAKAQAVVVNSGIANACTGAEGFGYCKDTADAAAKALNISADGVLIGSTGVIGKQIPIDKLTAGIKVLAGKKNDTLENGTEAAKAIMTTDTFPKELAVAIEVGGKTVTIGGMAKGSGMIHPNMCTMLAFITTDAVITKDALQKALSEDVGDTYNMISVDGDTSTNDSVVLLANGMAENPEITYGTEDYKMFLWLLFYCSAVIGVFLFRFFLRLVCVRRSRLFFSLLLFIRLFSPQIICIIDDNLWSRFTIRAGTALILLTTFRTFHGDSSHILKCKFVCEICL